MRTGATCGLAALAAAVLLVLSPLAGAARHDDGQDGRQDDRELSPRPANRFARPSPLQRAFGQCQARGANGAALQRCAELVLGGTSPAVAVRVASGALDGRQGGGNGQTTGNGGGSGQPSPQGGQGQQQPPATTQRTAPAAATQAAAPEPSGPVVPERGIVQAVGPEVIVLRALDGSSIVIPIDVLTRIYFGERPADLGEVRPGAVATVRHRNGGSAIDIRVALAPKPRLRTDRGLVVSSTPTLVVVQLRDGTSVSIAMNPPTTVVTAPNGVRLFPGDMRPGFLVDITYDPAGTVPAQTVKIIRRVS